MAWLYLSDPDNREAVLEFESPPEPPPPPSPSPAAPRPVRRPVKGFTGRYQFVLPGFDHLVGQTAVTHPRRRAS